jgi:hypothetical protein
MRGTLYSIEELVTQSEDLVGILEGHLPKLRQSQSSRVSLEQFLSKSLFETANLRAHRRLR